MRRSYMVRWNDTGVGGFGSVAAAQQYIDKVCMRTAPDHKYRIEQEFTII